MKYGIKLRLWSINITARVSTSQYWRMKTPLNSSCNCPPIDHSIQERVCSLTRHEYSYICWAGHSRRSLAIRVRIPRGRPINGSFDPITGQSLDPQRTVILPLFSHCKLASINTCPTFIHHIIHPEVIALYMQRCERQLLCRCQTWPIDHQWRYTIPFVIKVGFLIYRQERRTPNVFSKCTCMDVMFNWVWDLMKGQMHVTHILVPRPIT